MVIAAECSLEFKFALMSSHVLRRAVVHECPFRKPDKFPLRKSQNFIKFVSWGALTLRHIPRNLRLIGLSQKAMKEKN